MIPTPSVAIKLLKGDTIFTKTNIGKIVSETNVKRPGIVISCFLPQLPHSIDL